MRVWDRMSCAVLEPPSSGNEMIRRFSVTSAKGRYHHARHGV